MFTAGLQQIDSKTVEDIFKGVMQGDGQGEQGPGSAQSQPQTLPPVSHPAHPQEQHPPPLPGLQPPQLTPGTDYFIIMICRYNTRNYA